VSRSEAREAGRGGEVMLDARAALAALEVLGEEAEQGLATRRAGGGQRVEGGVPARPGV
jgi:hypothetical protein